MTELENNFYPVYSMNRNLIAYLLVPLTGVFLLFHHIGFQMVLGQGDHGRDLYVFAQTLHGQIPYRDYWWVYGPLMPYYYALFFKIFGLAIPSILAGKILLTVISGTLIFFTLSRAVPPLFAFMGALWFWTFQPDFYFTYNHIGGVTCTLALVFCLVSYIHKQRPIYLGFGLFFVFLLSLIKVNFGLANLLALIATYRCVDLIYKTPPSAAKKKIAFASGLIVPGLILIIYGALFWGMAPYEIKQCFPYLTGDQPYHSTPWQSLYALGRAIIFNIIQRPPGTFLVTANTAFAIMTIIAFVLSIIQFFSPKIPTQEKRSVAGTYIFLIFLYFINLHEYILSGVLYRSYWATPLSTILLFLTIGYGFSRISKSLQKTLFLAFFFIVFLQFSNNITLIQATDIDHHYLKNDRGRAVIRNQPLWFATVHEATDFLQKNVGAAESFLALPYDPLYYYLTDKRSPTRQLIFFEHINIPPEQELSIIKELEQNNTNWIALSNRSISQEAGLGILGTTYCPLIGQYIRDHFVPVATFGPWEWPAHWQANHAVTILKRKDRDLNP